jgi:hypothetical protein
MGLLDNKPCKGCKEMFTPKVEWQKFCKKACHDKYWKGIYQEKAVLNRRLEKVERELGIK